MIPSQNAHSTTAAADPGAKPVDDLSDLGAAYRRRVPEMLAIPEAELVRVTIDINAAATTVIGALKKIAPFRAAIAKLDGVDQALVDGLEDFALAVQEADGRYLTAATPREDIVALNNEATKLRDVIRVDTAALAKRGLIDPEGLAPFKGATGYKNVARDLIDYAILLSANWTKIQGKTALTESDVQNVKLLGARLMRAAGEREQAPLVMAETADIRRRAVTRFLQSYDEVRRALTFLRWKEDDVETIAPSLFAGRGGRGTAPDPADDAGTNASASATAAADTASAVNAPAGPAPKAAPVPVGYPGSSPFLTSK